MLMSKTERKKLKQKLTAPTSQSLPINAQQTWSEELHRNKYFKHIMYIGMALKLVDSKDRTIPRLQTNVRPERLGVQKFKQGGIEILGYCTRTNSSRYLQDLLFQRGCSLFQGTVIWQTKLAASLEAS